MKKLIFIFMLTLTLNAADFTNDGATLTIGEGVTLRSDGSFENNGILVNDGTFAISGAFSGTNSLAGTDVTYFGDAQVMEMNYNNLTIEGANTLSNSVQANDLIISGDLNLSGHSVHILNSFVRNGGDISGEGFLQATPIIEFPALENVYGLGFIVSHLGTADINIMRYAGMVDNNDRVSLNGYFHIDLILGDAFPDIPPTIGIALEEQDLNGMNIENLSLFHSSDLENWTMVGGEVSENNILLFDPEDELLSGYFTVGQIGCVDDQAANYESIAFGGEYTCNYNFSEPFSAGLNLKSFYSLDDANNSVENILSSLDQAMDIIGEGEAANLHPILGWIGSLTNINRDQGYWVRLYDSDVYEHPNGKADTTSMVYSIHEGANLISYSGPTPTSVGEAMPQESSCYAAVGQGVATTYNPALGWIGSLTEFEPWGGYWLKCTESEEFIYQGHGTLPRQDIEVIPVPEEFTFVQSTQQAFYFIEDIKDAQVGRDFIIARYGDDIVGSIAYSGEYTTVPVMGAFDNIPGFKVGEQVSFELYNSDNQKYYYLEGQDLPTFENLGINIVGVMSQLPVIPEQFMLHHAYPNPFNPSTTIRFDVMEEVKVKLEVYDLNGRLVSTINNKTLEPGYYQMSWDASQFASGPYFVRLSAGSFINTQKITLIK